MHHSSSCPEEASETFFSHDDCQSRIDSRNGSNASTLISTRVAHRFLAEAVDIVAFSSNRNALVTCIRSGNRAYDNLSCAGFFSAEEAVHIQQSLNLAVKRDVFLREDEWRRFEEEISRDAGHSCNGRAAGILVTTPYSFGVCYEQGLDFGKVFIFDSHGEYGSLAAIVPSDKIPKYLEYFFNKWYPYRPFSTEKRRLCTFLS